jgi:hypothetical protein
LLVRLGKYFAHTLSCADTQHMQQLWSDIEDKVSSVMPFRKPVALTELPKLQQHIKNLAICADELVDATNIIWSQLPHKNWIWIKGISLRNVGSDVSLLVKDVHYIERRGRQHERTWAKNGDCEAACHSQNMMGYQICDSVGSSPDVSNNV